MGSSLVAVSILKLNTEYVLMLMFQFVILFHVVKYKIALRNKKTEYFSFNQLEPHIKAPSLCERNLERLGERLTNQTG